VAIIGGGPAGLMAAARAAARGRKTILLEKNREPGVKILLSGGTRCNLTHATDARGIVEAFGPAGRFLHSALAALGPQEVVELFAAEGVPTKIEPGGKVFPASDRASDVRAALVRRARRSGCELAMGEALLEIVRGGKGDRHLLCEAPFGPCRQKEPVPFSAGFRLVTPRRSIEADRLILAVGGQSYPACGTTGDGYRFAAALGHRIVRPHTGLVPITSHAPWVTALQGITLPDVVVSVVDPAHDVGATVALPPRSAATLGQQYNCRPNYEKTDRNVCPPVLAMRRGALLFAHFGVTGPAVMDVSHAVSGHAQPQSLVLRCDLLPEISESQLDAMLSQEIAAGRKRRVGTLLDRWLPHRVGETLVVLTGAPPDQPAAEFSKQARRKLAGAVKRLDIPVVGTMGFRKAEVTAGGVALEEVDSRTMQSKLVPNLYFAGELLDLNGPVGGYNFQAAFSTGWLAGESV
jgi:predicted flavoprotein YhiN